MELIKDAYEKIGSFVEKCKENIGDVSTEEKMLQKIITKKKKKQC